MSETPLADFFEANIAPEFRNLNFEPAMIHALRGCFIMGAEFGLKNMQVFDEMHSEIDAFHAIAAPKGRGH